MRGFAVLTAVLAASGALVVAGCGGDDDDAAGDTSGDVTVPLGEASLSGQTGTATLSARGEQTHVSIEIDGEAVSDSQPAHIHEGNCGSVPGDLDPEPAFGLPNVVRGVSEATVDVPLETLTNGRYAINLHRSDDDLATYTSCGKIEK